MKSLLLLVFVSAFVFCTGCVASARAKSSRMPSERIKLYYLPPSPPCRAVMMVAKAVGLDLDLVMTNLMTGDHMTPEFLKMNPQHTIPTMDDNGFILWESRAIMAYFVNAYGRDDSLYPKNPRLRAVIDQRMNFDLGTLFARFVNLYFPAMMSGSPLDDASIEKMNEALGFLDKMLEGKAFVAGENLSIADFAIVVTVSNLDALKFDLSSYENINKWFDRTKKALEPYGYAEINEVGVKIYSDFLSGNKQALD